MTRFAYGFLGLGFATALSAAAAQPQKTLDPDVAKVVEGNTAFALDLYGQLAKKNDENLFFSPYSISTALAMTFAGAGGETAAEMAKTLHFQVGHESLHPAFGRLVRDINAQKGPGSYQLTTANRLWGQAGYPLVPSFLQLTADHYNAGFKEVDFKNATEDARRAINAWVEEQTQKKIKDLILPGVLDNFTRLVLTNAIYFKAEWDKPFSPKATKPGEFKMTSAKSISAIPMMSKLATTAKLHNGDRLQILDLPYSKGELSMLIFLPKAIDGLAELERSMVEAPVTISDWMKKMESANVAVTMPKFKITRSFRLDQQLASLGMKTAFDRNKADFTGMSTEKPFYISAVVHKAFVDVNEEGTEAAAASAVAMKGGGASKLQVQFRADHPFLFLIRDNQTGSVLFLGRVMDPRG